MEDEFIGRAIIREYDDILEIKIPTRKKIFEILFFCLWLIGWGFGEVLVIKTIFNINILSSFIYKEIFIIKNFESLRPIFLSVWLICWTIGGIGAIYTLFWKLIGYELITVENANLKISKKLGLINRKRKYEIREIKDMAIIQSTLSYNDKDFFTFENQKIKLRNSESYFFFLYIKSFVFYSRKV
ncbi:hypothetical protein [Oceanivirga salmonicida]|uniref:hypothetical protein n=1 Tax=Oceanivirga salmonicida TaxID=1769291 RepID=UPI0012E17291|nr:hypothetical protein [Oceanivirga salmonicida]